MVFKEDFHSVEELLIILNFFRTKYLYNFTQKEKKQKLTKGITIKEEIKLKEEAFSDMEVLN